MSDVGLLEVRTEIPSGLSLEQARWVLKYMVDGLARAAVIWFSGEKPMPFLYESGVRYEPESGYGTGVEMFDLPPTVFKRGTGDCDDLCIWRIAELLAHGIEAECSISDWQEMGGMHCQVRLPDGSIEDPSVLLGCENQWPLDFLYDR